MPGTIPGIGRGASRSIGPAGYRTGPAAAAVDRTLARAGGNEGRPYAS